MCVKVMFSSSAELLNTFQPIPYEMTPSGTREPFQSTFLDWLQRLRLENNNFLNKSNQRCSIPFTNPPCKTLHT